MLSMCIVTVCPWTLSIANEDFDSLVNLREPGEKPLCKKTNSQSFELQRNLRKCVSSPSIFTAYSASFQSIVAMQQFVRIKVLSDVFSL